MNAIEPGNPVVVRTADDDLLPRRAITPVQMGSTFEVVWVCKEDEWEAAIAEQRDPDGMPWPADAVELAKESVAV